MASDASYSITVSKVPRTSQPDEAASNPHHVVSGNRVTGFKNPYPSYSTVANPMVILRQIIWPRITGKLSMPDLTPPHVTVTKPTFLGRAPTANLRATWLGHACYYVEYPSGLRVLFDPVFEDRCGPYGILGPKRYTTQPCTLESLPAVDAVVISHSHYDHLSHSSVLTLQKHHPHAHFFVGLGLEKWFRSSGLRNVTELDWWEDADLKLTVRRDKQHDTDIDARISCLPSQHTSARSPFDRDTTLWCSWSVRSGDRNVWFGGDTGYRSVPRLPADVDDYGPQYDALPRCPQFKQIGDLRGPFDLGLIPIGAYAPRGAFSGMHANPFDSVEIFKDTRCKRAMGIHWGTWALTTEAVLEPPKLLQDALKKKGIEPTGVFDVCDIGESREF